MVGMVGDSTQLSGYRALSSVGEALPGVILDAPSRRVLEASSCAAEPVRRHYDLGSHGEEATLRRGHDHKTGHRATLLSHNAEMTRLD